MCARKMYCKFVFPLKEGEEKFIEQAHICKAYGGGCDC
jgi:hypothetical protein